MSCVGTQGLLQTGLRALLPTQSWDTSVKGQSFLFSEDTPKIHLLLKSICNSEISTYRILQSDAYVYTAQKILRIWCTLTYSDKRDALPFQLTGYIAIHMT